MGSNKHFQKVYMDILECVKWNEDKKSLDNKRSLKEEDGVLWGPIFIGTCERNIKHHSIWI